jgi:hypothetical protein
MMSFLIGFVLSRYPTPAQDHARTCARMCLPGGGVEQQLDHGSRAVPHGDVAAVDEQELQAPGVAIRMGRMSRSRSPKASVTGTSIRAAAVEAPWRMAVLVAS